jgi:biopolymer transport protein ExbD
MEPEQDKSTEPGEQLRGFVRKRKHRRFNLRMTPMIDVIFLLLIFFVLTARFREPEGFLGGFLPDDKSEVNTGRVIEPLTLYISDTEGGRKVEIGPGESVFIYEGKVDEGLADFANKLGEVLAAQKRTSADAMEIECDDDVEWDYLVKIYNVLTAMGVEDITFDMDEAATLNLQ